MDGFWIDRHPVTVAEFRRFVKATGHVTWAEHAPRPEDYPDAEEAALVPGSYARLLARQRHARPLRRSPSTGANLHPEGAPPARCYSAAARSRIHLACTPMADPDEAATIVNALQRHAAVVVQKSIAEGLDGAKTLPHGLAT